ncbi:hypothetical protein OTK49_00295 [Vibrio coralliirubri]|uniref:FliG C-terminal domain-containing protein n=1 Tax=Vibrio coralliirubri TaxID=1516159 RepID=UPI002284D94B|nr:FliG C-terminal domain-containing protein [Vibrio coralliirubri]MCY9860980.1 hypothetical protein [Vibrio coralliirubri]
MINNNNLTGTQKIALLIRTVGYNAIVPNLRNLQLDDSIYAQIDNETPDTISKSTALAVLREFNASASLVVGGKRESLLDAIEDMGMNTGNSAKLSRKMHGFKKLQTMSADEIHQLIINEQPLHKAIIMFELPEKVSVEIFSLMTLDEQAKLTMEADKAESPSNQTLSAINGMLEEKLANQSNKSVGNLERIFAFTDGMDEVQLNSYLEKLPEEIASKIRANVLTFTHITEQSEKVLIEILGESSSNDIAQAFCQSSEEILEKMTASLTKTKAQDVTFSIDKTVNKEDKKAISEAQRAIILRAKQLQSDGKIIIVR